MRHQFFCGSVLALLSAAAPVAQTPLLYTEPITIENAKKAAAPARAEAAKNNWAMASAVVDPAGSLVYFETFGGTSQQDGQCALAGAAAVKTR